MRTSSLDPGPDGRHRGACPPAVLTHFSSCYTEIRRTSHRPIDGGSLEALLEQRALGGCGDRFHRGVLQLSLDRDCIKAFPHCVEPADGLYVVLPARLLFHRRWAGEQPHSGLAEHFQQPSFPLTSACHLPPLPPPPPPSPSPPPVLQLVQLFVDGGLGQVQLLAGTGNGVAHNDPEIEQMVVVQPIRGAPRR